MPMIDIRSGKQYSLSPFFEAGKAEPFIYAHRDEGSRYTASGFVNAIGNDITAPNMGATSILTAKGASGIQGFTLFQANVEVITL